MKKLLFILLWLPIISFCNIVIDSLEVMLKNSSGHEKHEVLLTLSKQYWTIDPEVSEKYAHQALEYAIRTKDNELLAKSYKDLGSAYLFQDKIDDAHKYYLLAYDYYEEIGDESGISKVSNNIGYSYYQLAKYDKALEYYFKAIEIDKKHGNREEHFTTLQNVGSTYIKLKEYDKALDYYIQCMKYYKSENNIAYLIEIYNNIGSAYLEMGKYYKALEYLNRSKLLSEENGDYTSYAKILNNLGDVYFYLNEFDEAINFYQESLKYSKQIKHKWTIANTTLNLGTTFRKIGEMDSCIKFLLNALDYSQEIKAGELIQRSYHELANYYEKINDFENSLFYFKLYSTTKDSIFNKEKFFQISKLQSVYDISTQDNEEKLSRQNIKLKNYIIYAFASIFLIVFLLVILIFLRYKSVNSIKNTLNEKNKKISEQNILLEKTLAGLKESEEKYKTLIKNIHDGLCVLQNDRIVFVNNVFSKITGLQESLLINTPLANIISETEFDNVRAFIHQINQDKISKTIDIKLKGVDGNKYVNATFGTLYFNGEPAIMCTIKDINEQKLYEQKLIKEQKRAIQAKESRTMLLASISHEIKNHLQSLTGMSEVLSDIKLNDDQLNYIKTIDTSGKSILNIIGDVLDYSKIEARQITLKETEFKLSDVFKDLDLLYKKQVTEKGIKYKTNIDDVIPTKIIGDMERLKQILINLISNAYKYTDTGEIRLNAKLKSIDTDSKQCTIKFEVIDTGSGIPIERQKNIFSPFAQTDVSVLTKKGGTGLGLAISKNLVSLFGGIINVESSLHKGSVFWFTANFTLTKNYFQQSESHQNYQNLSVLTVDDDEFNINYILKILQNLSIHVDVASNGKDAFEKYKKNLYDVVLMDIQMPVMDGFESTALIRKYESDNNLKKAKIIAVTAFAHDGRENEFKKVGMDGFLEKPFISKDLIKFVISS